MTDYISTLIDTPITPTWDITPPPPQGKKSKKPKFEVDDTLTVSVTGQPDGESATLSFTSNTPGANLYSPFTEYNYQQPKAGYPYALGDTLHFANPSVPGSLWTFTLTYISVDGVATTVSLDPELQVGTQG
jgi:hypothetical protein